MNQRPMRRNPELHFTRVVRISAIATLLTCVWCISRTRQPSSVPDNYSQVSQKLSMHICLDIDDTITYQPTFFARLTRTFADARVTVVTFRTDFEAAASCLDEIGVRYDQLIVSSDPEFGKLESELLQDWKSRLINEIKPDIFFEDMPEVVASIDDGIAVFQPCDSVIRSWMRTQLAGN